MLSPKSEPTLQQFGIRSFTQPSGRKVVDRPVFTKGPKYLEANLTLQAVILREDDPPAESLVAKLNAEAEDAAAETIAGFVGEIIAARPGAKEAIERFNRASDQHDTAKKANDDATARIKEIESQEKHIQATVPPDALLKLKGLAEEKQHLQSTMRYIGELEAMVNKARADVESSLKSDLNHPRTNLQREKEAEFYAAVEDLIANPLFQELLCKVYLRHQIAYLSVKPDRIERVLLRTAMQRSTPR